MNEVAINAPNLWRLETPGHSGWERTARVGDAQKYFMVSTDSHANEPPDLWEKRIDAKYRERVPRIITDEQERQAALSHGLLLTSGGGEEEKPVVNCRDGEQGWQVSLPAESNIRGAATRSPAPAFGLRPVQFVDVFPNTPDRKVNLFPALYESEAPMGLYGFQPDPATEQYPLALISPSSERTINSTLGQLPRPDVKLVMHPDDARVRGLSDGDLVRIFNDLGERYFSARLWD